MSPLNIHLQSVGPLGHNGLQTYHFFLLWQGTMNCRDLKHTFKVCDVKVCKYAANRQDSAYDIWWPSVECWCTLKTRSCSPFGAGVKLQGLFQKISIFLQLQVVLAKRDCSVVHLLFTFTECVRKAQNQCPRNHERVPRHVRRRRYDAIFSSFTLFSASKYWN